MPKVVILKAKDYGKGLDNLVSKAMDLAGLKPPKRGMVLVKANLLRPCAPKEAVNTHPEFVKSVVKSIRKYNKNIVVGDGVGKTRFEGGEEILGNNGTEKAIKGLATPKNFDDESVLTNIKNKNFPKIKIAKIVGKADYIISVPKMKTHALAYITGAVKNHFGYINKDHKALSHAKNWIEYDLNEFLLDVYLATKADFSIMDGIVGMEGEGPSSGKPIKSKVILASTDAISLDYVASQIMGYDPKVIPLFNIAQKRGIFEPKDIEIVGENISDVKLNFRKPVSKKIMFLFAPAILNLLTLVTDSPFAKKHLMRKITLNKKRCIRCGKCMRACPVGAIKLQPYPVIDCAKCIRCFCCMEHCPENALSYKYRF